MPVPVIIIVIAATTYLLGFPVAKLLAHSGMVDTPNARSSHSSSIARGGGLAIAGTSILLVFFGWPLQWNITSVVLVGAFGIGIVSLIDDRTPLNPAIRFGCHSSAAVGTLIVLKGASLKWGMDSAASPGGSLALAMLLSFLWIVGYTNAFNFMDGINGLAAGQAIVTGFGMALLTSLVLHSNHSPPVLWSVAIGSAALGFLPHNFPQARMFMGDVGSAPLGFWLAVLVLWLAVTAGVWLLIPLALLHANFVLDTGITFVRRILKGERWYEAHREHYYQRLIRSGKSHTFVTGWEMALQALVLGLMVLYIYAGVFLRVTLCALVILIWLGFFAFCERSFRKNQTVRLANLTATHAGPQ